MASLDCFNNTRAGGPTTARYEMFPDQATLDNQFQIDVNHAAIQPCPGSGQAGPTNWDFKNNANVVAGSIMCYTVNNTPSLEWSNNQYLTIADTGGPDMAGLHEWWLHLP